MADQFSRDPRDLRKLKRSSNFGSYAEVDLTVATMVKLCHDLVLNGPLGAPRGGIFMRYVTLAVETSG